MSKIVTMIIVILSYFWGYVGINVEWGPLYYTYGEFLNAVIGYDRFGIGTTGGEALSNGKEIDASLMPIHMSYLIWRRESVNDERVYFKDFLMFRFTFTPWGTRWVGEWIFGDYYNKGKFIADIDYFSLGLFFYKNILWYLYIKSDLTLHIAPQRILPTLRVGVGLNIAGLLFTNNLKNSLLILKVIQSRPIDADESVVLEVIVKNRGYSSLNNLKVYCDFDKRFSQFIKSETLSVDGIGRNEVKKFDLRIFRKEGYFPSHDIDAKLIIEGGKNERLVKRVTLKHS